MAEAKHTPGPWEWVKDSDGIAFLKGGGLYVLSPEFSADDERVHVDTWLDVSDANAALIAAAPELLKALTGLVTFFSPPGECSMERFERLAAEFYRETGMLAPGKSEPMECSYQGRDEERRERYDRWVADRVAAARAAIAKAEGANG